MRRVLRNHLADKQLPGQTCAGMNEELQCGTITHHHDLLDLERLELALKASNEGIWDWWTDSPEIYYSRRSLKFLECPADDAPHLFLAPFEHIHPEERERFAQDLGLCLRKNGLETFAVDARVKTCEGSWCWLRIRGSVLRNNDGMPYRIVGSMIDISRRKNAETQLEEERFLLRQLIEHIPLQIYFKDLESRFVMANQKMLHWMGISSSADLAGKHDRDFFGEEHWKPAAEDEKLIMDSGKAITGLLEHETWREGEESWVQTSKFPWRDRHGKIKGTFGVSSDVTTLVQAQREATGLAELLQAKNTAYEEEVNLAREVQYALTGKGFPEVKSESGRAKFSARYIPISGLAGDFYEVIQISPTSAGVLIADVMGHGVRAALIVAMLRGLLEKQRQQAGDPGAFLHGLNEGLAAILSRAEATLFATAFYGVIDLANNTFQYSCAGHPGPIIAGPEGVRQIAATRAEKGPGLGLIRGAVYPVTTLPLKSIHRLMLFTDGILEAENKEGEPFFEKRLMEIIAHSTSETLDGLLDSILSSVLAFSEARQFDDDVCLLGIEVPS